MDELKDTRERFCDELIQAYAEAGINKEEDLMTTLRHNAPGELFLPFLQCFIRRVREKGLTIRSAYLPKTLVNNHRRLSDRDTISYREGDIKVDDEKAIQKGMILDLIMSMGLDETMDMVIRESKDREIQEIEEDLLSHPDADQLIRSLSREMQKNLSKTPLIHRPA